MHGGYPARLISTALDLSLSDVGRVHSVFRGALNVEFGPDLVSLAGPATGGLPNGIVLGAELDFLGLGLAPGWRVRRTPERLWVERSRLAVDLRPAQRWSPRLERCALRPAREILGALEDALRQVPVRTGLAPLLLPLARGEAPGSGLPRTCAAAYPAIVGLAQARDSASMLASARGLIGLGEGLTPSGDDFLVGFLAARRATGGPPSERAFAEACAEMAKGRTTRIAETFLAHAARGEYSARVHKLVRALSWSCSSGEGVPAAELAAALGWGASSGADTLLGVLVGGGG
jgi:hypothetical protein